MCNQQSQQTTACVLPKHSTPAKQNSVFFNYGDTVKIKPFVSLDEAFTSASKVAQLAYGKQGASEQEQKNLYQASVAVASARFVASEEQDRYETLVDLLGVVLMGFDPNSMSEVKEDLKASLEAVAKKEIRQNTEQFLTASGFAKKA
jgi:hypothetical protein